MIETILVDGRKATVAYLKKDFTPTEPADAEMVKILFDDDGSIRIAYREEDSEQHDYIIRHEGSKWVVRTEDGARVLGSHDTEGEAKAQLQAIEISKHQKKPVVKSQ